MNFSESNMQHALNWIWNTLSSGMVSSWWLWYGLAHTLAILVVARIITYSYREHAYLYHMADSKRALDNWIALLLPFLKRLKLTSYRSWINMNLARAGYRRDWDANHFMARQLIYAAGSAVAVYVFFVLLLGQPFIFAALAGFLAALILYLQLQERATKRFKSCQKDLPFFIDYLALAMGAGLDFNQGLASVISDAPKSPLRDEFLSVMRNMKLGMSREQALLEMDARLDAPGLKLFIQTLVQAMKMGSDVVNTLIVLSEGLQSKRFLSAEEQAGKISIRMMIPLMVFVLPSTMIVLIGPLVLEWLGSM